jgi:hypothetical protein
MRRAVWKFTDVSEVPFASFIKALMMEAANTSKTSADFCQTTRRNNPENSSIQLSKLPLTFFNKINH